MISIIIIRFFFKDNPEETATLPDILIYVLNLKMKIMSEYIPDYSNFGSQSYRKLVNETSAEVRKFFFELF